MLAPYCARLLATELSARAVERARLRCASLAHDDIAQGRFPDTLPQAPVDLVVLSEIGYYFAPDAIAVAVERVTQVGTVDGAADDDEDDERGTADRTESGHAVRFSATA